MSTPAVSLRIDMRYTTTCDARTFDGTDDDFQRLLSWMRFFLKGHRVTGHVVMLPDGGKNYRCAVRFEDGTEIDLLVQKYHCVVISDGPSVKVVYFDALARECVHTVIASAAAPAELREAMTRAGVSPYALGIRAMEPPSTITAIIDGAEPDPVTWKKLQTVLRSLPDLQGGAPDEV